MAGLLDDQPQYTNVLDSQPVYTNLLDRRAGLVDRTAQGQALTPQETAQTDMESATFLDEIRKGLRRFGYSAASTTQGALGSILAPVLPNVGNDLIKQGLRTMEEMPNNLRPAVENWADVNDFRSGALKVGSALGEGAPSAALTVAGSVAGRGLGAGVGALRGLRGTAAMDAAIARGGFAGGMATMLPMEAGETALELAKDPVAMQNTTPWQRAGLSVGRGLVNAAAESVVPNMLVAPHLLGQAARIAPGFKAGLRNTALLGAEGAIGEYGTEAAQELTGQFAQNLANPATGYDLRKAHEAGLSGAVVGAGLGGAGGLAQSAYSTAAPLVDKAQELGGQLRDKLPNVPTADDVLGKLRQLSENPEQFGADIAESMKSGYAKASDVASKAGKVIGEAAGTAEEKIGAVYDAMVLHAKNYIKDPENRAFFLEQAGKIKSIGSPERAALLDSMTGKSPVEFLQAAGVSAVTFGDRLGKSAVAGVRHAARVVDGWAKGMVDSMGDTKAQMSLPSPENRKKAWESMLAGTPSLKPQMDHLPEKLKTAVASLFHHGMEDRSYWDSGGKHVMDPINDWYEWTGTDLRGVLDAGIQQRNQRQLVSATDRELDVALKEMKVPKSRHADLKALARDVEMGVEFKDLPQVDQDKLKASAKNNGLEAIVLFQQLKSAVYRGQKERDKSDAKAAGGVKSQFDNLEDSESPNKFGKTMRTSDNSKWEDGEQYDEIDPDRSPYNLDAIRESLASEKYASDRNVSVPIKLRASDGELDALGLAKLIGKRTGDKADSWRGYNDDETIPGIDMKTGEVNTSISPMSLAMMVQNEKHRDRFESHMDDIGGLDTMSPGMLTGKRFLSALASLNTHGIHIDPEDIGLPPGDPVHITADVDLNALHNNLIISRGKGGTDVVKWGDVSGDFAKARSQTRQNSRLFRGKGEVTPGLAKKMQKSKDKEWSLTDHAIFKEVDRRARNALSKNKEYRDPTSEELDAALQEYVIDLPKILKNNKKWERMRQAATGLAAAYRAGDITKEELQAIIGYYSTDTEKLDKYKKIKEADRTPAQQAVIDQNNWDYETVVKMSTFTQNIPFGRKGDKRLVKELVQRLDATLTNSILSQQHGEHVQTGGEGMAQVYNDIESDWADFKGTFAQRTQRQQDALDRYSEKRRNALIKAGEMVQDVPQPGSVTGGAVQVYEPEVSGKTKPEPIDEYVAEGTAGKERPAVKLQPGQRFAIQWHIDGKQLKPSKPKYVVTKFEKTDNGYTISYRDPTNADPAKAAKVYEDKQLNAAGELLYRGKGTGTVFRISTALPVSEAEVAAETERTAKAEAEKIPPATKEESSGKPTRTMTMVYRDGQPHNMRPEFKGKSTMDLIESGDRTATTRSRSGVAGIKVGDVITFKGGGRSVDVRVTKAPYKVSTISAEDWSKLEGWAPETHEKYKDAWQFQYERVGKEAAPAAAAAPAEPAASAAPEKQTDADAAKVFDDYVKRGRYSQWFHDMVKKVGAAGTKALSAQIRAHRMDQIEALKGAKIAGDGSSIAGMSQELREKIGAAIDGTVHRVMVGNHGVYVEFTPANEGDLTFVKNRLQYDEYKDADGNKLYKQTKTVNYANYRVGKWYVALTDVLGAPAAPAEAAPAPKAPTKLAEGVYEKVMASVARILETLHKGVVRIIDKLPDSEHKTALMKSAEDMRDGLLNHMKENPAELLQELKTSSAGKVLTEFREAMVGVYDKYIETVQPAVDALMSVPAAPAEAAAPATYAKNQPYTNPFNGQTLPVKASFEMFGYTFLVTPVEAGSGFHNAYEVETGRSVVEGGTRGHKATIAAAKARLEKIGEETVVKTIEKAKADMKPAEPVTPAAKTEEKPAEPATPAEPVTPTEPAAHTATPAAPTLSKEELEKQRYGEIMASKSETQVTYLNGGEPYSRAKLHELMVAWSKKYMGGRNLSLHIYEKKPGDPRGFVHYDRPNTIFIANEAVSHLNTISTLSHEFGHLLQHHVYENAAPDVKARIFDRFKEDVKELKAGNMTTQRALELFGSAGYAELVTVHPKFISLTAPSNLKARKDTEEFSDYVTEFDEWFANNFSRYVTSGVDKNLSEAEQSFWKKLLATMKDFYDNVVAKLTPATEFADWVKSLSEADEGPSSIPPSDEEAPSTPPPSDGGSTPPPTPPTPPSGGEEPPGGEQPKKRRVTKKEKEAREKVLAVIHRLLGEKRVKVLFGVKLENAVSGDFKTRRQQLEDIISKRAAQINMKRKALAEDPKADISEFNDAIKAFDKQEQAVLADTVTQGFIRIAAGRELKAGVGEHEAFHAAFALLFNEDERRILGQAFTQGLAGKRLRELYKDNPLVLAAINRSPEEAATYAFEMWAADPDNFQLGPRVENLFQQFLNFIRKIFGVLTNEEKADLILKDFYEGNRHEHRISPVARSLDKTRPWTERAQDMLKDVGGLVKSGYDILLAPIGERLESSNNPSLVKIKKLGYQATGEEGNEAGMVQRGRIQYTKHMNHLNRIFDKLSEDQLKELHLHMVNNKRPPDEKVAERWQQLKDWYKEMYTYQTGAGVDLKNAGQNQAYYPMTWNPEKVKANKKEFLEMLEKNYANELLNTKKTPNEIFYSITSYIERGEDLVNVMGVNGEPLAESSKKRTLHFIKKEHRLPFMDEDPVHTAYRYAKQAVRQAEYVRSYGLNGEELKRLRDEAQHVYGASPEELALANDYIDGLMGNKEVGMSRELKDLYGGLAVYQNYRLLPFSLFASLVDPVGISVRSGSAMDAWDTFTYSMGNLFKGWGSGEYTRDFWERLAEDWGIIEHAGTTQSAHNQFEGITLRGTTKDLNDKLFKYNLLNGWIRNNTIMATKAAQRFIYRSSKDEAGPGSARYMEELGLTKDDVVYDEKQGRLLMQEDELVAAGKTKEEAKEIEEKLRNATAKFVRQALLNPSSAELPNWASNPYLAPIAHLKSFVFAFQATIIDRVLHEAKHGNYRPAALAVAYVPGMIAADFIKDMIAGFGEEPPYKKNWGLFDYFMNGVDRSGLTGVGQLFSDLNEDAVRGGTGVLGPAAQQTQQGLKAFASGNDGAITNWIVKSMPLQPVYKQHLPLGPEVPQT